MEGRRFDDLTRAVTGGAASRRAMLKGLLGTGAVGVGLIVPGGRAAAKNRSELREGTCKGAKDVCSGGSGRCNQNPNCICSRGGKRDGRLVCHDGRFAACFRCDGDSDCRAEFGPDAVCFKRDNCCDGRSSCLTPCGKGDDAAVPSGAARSGYGR